MKLVLDTNCIIDLEEYRESYPHLMKILSKWRDGDIELGVVAIGASEKQKEGHYSESFKNFEKKLANVGLQGVKILPSIVVFDVSYFDQALLCDKRMAALEDKIRKILFPNTPLELPNNDERKKMDWINEQCDVQIAWAVIYHKWETLVTRDGNFHENAKDLLPLGLKEVLTPCEAAKRVEGN